MNEKFTKGPWSINNTGPHWNNPELANIEINYGEDQECVCDTVYEISDAHLIAAAPEMYEMIDQLSHELLFMIRKENSRLMQEVNCTSENPPDYIDEESVYLAQKLLSKARGEL